MGRILMILQDCFLRIIWWVRAGARVSLLSIFSPTCKFGRNVRVERMCILHDTTFGDFSYAGDSTRIINAAIGRFCSISGSVQIGLGRHPAGMVSSSPVFYSNHNALRTHWLAKEPDFEAYRKVTIGHDVWIGMHAMVRDGITIGNGAVIGAGAVVTKDVEPYSVVAGVPARCIRKRFDDETIRKLERLRWWDWPAEQIRRNAALFADTEAFVQISVFLADLSDDKIPRHG